MRKYSNLLFLVSNQYFLELLAAFAKEFMHPRFQKRKAHIGGFQLEFVSISRVMNHMTFVIIRVLSFVEITAFRLESKSCKGFFF